MSVINTHIVVLHKIEDAMALLEKRSAIYSDRPIMPIYELLGMGSGSSLLPYGNRWRKHRRVFQEVLRKDRTPLYHHTMTEKVHILLGELLNEPEDFIEQCKWVASSFVLSATFAYNVPPERKNDPIIDTADAAGKLLTELIVPGRTLINAFPILGRIPPWVPTAYTQRLAAAAKQSVAQYKTEPFNYVKRKMAGDGSEDCMLADILKTREERGSATYDDDTLEDVMGTMYLAGAETVQSVQITLILSLAIHTEQQRKAQAEIDSVVGTDRLPTFDDRASLPYVEALFREIQRWRPVAPLGFVHTTVRDDTYNGFYIPRGTLVIPNVWAMTRDASKYHDPESFVPERFFNPNGTLNDDTIGYGFGFGRRICPGRHVAESILWLELACILSTFSISKAKDENGSEIDISPDAFLDAYITHPLPFKCSIVPRSKQTETLIHSAASNARRAR